MYDYRLVSAYMSHHMTPRERRPMTGHRVRRVYQLLDRATHAAQRRSR